MKESCYCGRTGELEEREPVLTGEGNRVLACPDCGHVDDLRWLPADAGLLLWQEAQRRRETSAEEVRPAA